MCQKVPKPLRAVWCSEPLCSLPADYLLLVFNPLRFCLLLVQEFSVSYQTMMAAAKDRAATCCHFLILAIALQISIKNELCRCRPISVTLLLWVPSAGYCPQLKVVSGSYDSDCSFGGGHRCKWLLAGVWVTVESSQWEVLFWIWESWGTYKLDKVSYFHFFPSCNYFSFLLYQLWNVASVSHILSSWLIAQEDIPPPWEEPGSLIPRMGDAVYILWTDVPFPCQ